MRGKAQRESARRAASPDFYRKWMLTIARPSQSHDASACQVSAQSSDPRLSYCDFTDFPQRGPKLRHGSFRGHRPIIGPTRY